MYLEHFGLAEAPFRITPRTDFFFAGARRGATLDALLYAIANDEGIVRVSGEVGSGKTMLCRMVMERLPERVACAYIASPNLSPDDIVHALADELKLGISAERPGALLRALQERLVELHAAGRRVVVLIDEAHAMPPATLEAIRLLSNLETGRSKLMQIVLFAQPELDHVLNQPGMRQLKDRITHRFLLEPLPREEVAAYIDFRLKAAGYRGAGLFSPEAIRAIAAASAGLTRRVTVLADKALLATFAANLPRVGAEQARLAIRDAGLDSADSGWLSRPTAWLVIAAGGMVLAAAYWSLVVLRDAPRIGLTKPIDPQPVAEPTTRPSEPAGGPAEVATAGKAGSGNMPPGQTAVGQATIGKATVGEPTVREATVGEPTIRERIAEAAKPQPDTVEADPAKQDSNPTAASSTGAGATGAGEEARPEGPLSASLRVRLEDSKAWLRETPGDRWFIQLISVEFARSQDAERFLARAERMIDAADLRVYRATIGGSDRLGVIYGDYPDLPAASRALAELPAELRSQGAFPRRIARLNP
jgi:type II secretory pathway predicted ATPase ExeA/septal ring-binding cell division protein DamX